MSSTVFSPSHSHILKSQISAFKCVMQNKPIPLELGQLINITYEQFKRQGVYSQQSDAQQNFQHMQQPQLDTHMQGKQQVQPVPPQPQRFGSKSSFDLSQASFSPNTPKNSIPQAAILPQHQQNQQPPVKRLSTASFGPTGSTGLPFHPPLLTEDIEKMYPNAKKTSVSTPLEFADSFTLPKFNPIPFDNLNGNKSRIFTPSFYPNVAPLFEDYANISPEDLKKITEDLALDKTYTHLKEMADKQANKELDDDNEIDWKLEFEAFKLLPFQKAVRGYIIATAFHQDMLLTNHLPNFSAKVRGITMNDASLINTLYSKKKEFVTASAKSEVIERQINIQNASNHFRKSLRHKRNKYQKIAKNVLNFHQATEKEEQKRMERNAKQRLQALKANDEEAYVKLLDQTKDTRITHLLKQTNAFLSSLTEAVKDQQKTSAIQMHDPVPGDDSDDEEQINQDYYHVAHKIKEKVTKQPSILVGGTLKEYQIHGLEWMVSLYNNHLNGILADEMGLGKTIQTISLLTYITEVKRVSGPFLVIVPLSTLPNWNMEFDKWAPSLKKICFKGSVNYRKSLYNEIRSGDFNILLTTYEYIIRDKAVLSKIRWVHMIIDEGHRMKNTKSKLSQTLNDFYHTDYRLILTGTPLQNNLPELWALLNFVLPKIFNSVKSFDEWFNTPFANAGTQDKIELSEEETLLVIRRLHKVLRPFLLRRLKKDVEKSLPSKVEKVLKCKKSSLQTKMYNQMLKYNKLFVGDKENNAITLKGTNNKLMQLRKICNHPFVFPAIENMINPTQENNDLIWRTSGKFELLDRILPKFRATGHRVLMFFQMTQIMDIMEDFLRYRDLQYMRLDGDTRADDRTSLLKDFNADDSPYFIFLLSTRAGGLGLNLQTADTVIIFDTDWNPHQDLQAQDRAHRIGQKNEVRILRLITSDSIEEKILEKANQKLDIDGKVIQAGKFDQKSTSEEQEALLRQLIENIDNGNENDDELDDEELNEILARSDSDLEIFRKIDDERDAQWNSNKPRLLSEEELPEVYNKEPEPEESKEFEQMMHYGRGARERKTAIYDDNITDEQWRREVDEFASDDDEPVMRKRKKPELEDDDGEYTRKKPEDTMPAISHKRKSKTVPLSRDPATIQPSDDELQRVYNISSQIFESVKEYVEAGRKLSKIFSVKPVRRMYPDYYVIIKHPMGLSNVKSRLQAYDYWSIEEFIKEMHIIFKNARIYNLEDSVIYNDSLILEKECIVKYLEWRHNGGDFAGLNPHPTTEAPLPLGPMDINNIEGLNLYDFDYEMKLTKMNGEQIPNPDVIWDQSLGMAVVRHLKGAVPTGAPSAAPVESYINPDLAGVDLIPNESNDNDDLFHPDVLNQPDDDFEMDF